jgi:hypothetical protein
MEAWPAQTFSDNASFTPVAIQLTPSLTLTAVDILIYESWPREQWPAQSSATIAAGLASPVNPPANYPLPNPAVFMNIRYQWMPEWWYAQSECAIAGGLAQLQVPPIYLPVSNVDDFAVIRMAWLEPDWRAQSAVPGAGFYPPLINALPFPLPHKEVYQWPQEAWPAQSNPRTAQTFAGVLASMPYISISSQMAIRAIWPQEDWKSQHAAPVAALPNIIKIIPGTNVPKMPIKLWPQESWPAQRGSAIASFFASIFVPPKAAPNSKYPFGVINSWGQPNWSTQHIISQTGAKPFNPPLPPAGFSVIDSGGRVVLSPKKLGETKLIPMDFISKLGVGETILSASANIGVYSGTDPSPGAMLLGPIGVSGSIAAQYVTGGVVGTVYELLYTVVTSAGQTLELSGYLSVAPDLI